MTDLRDTSRDRPESEGAAEEQIAGPGQEEENAPAVELHRMSRRLGQNVRKARQARILKLICALLAVSSAGAGAQTHPGTLPDSSTTSTQLPSLASRTAAAQLRFDRSLASSERLGISQPQVSEAVATRDPIAAFQEVRLRHRGPGVALMLVGAAGIITGLLIDESLITILGAGTGLVGLYLYLR